MKRSLIPLLLCASAGLTLSGCLKNVEYPIEGEPDTLTVLTEINSSDRNHVVILSLSRPEYIIATPGAEVSLSVNGHVYHGREIYDPSQAEDKEIIRKLNFFQATPYLIQAPVAPGDQVRLYTRYQGHTASSEATVPTPPEMVRVDTATVSKKTSYILFDVDTDFLEMAATFRDIPRQNNFYMLNVTYRVEGVHHFLDEQGRKVRADSTSLVIDQGEYRTFDDEILDDGLSSIFNLSILEQLLSLRHTHCFTDHLFKDKDATVRVYLPDIRGFADKMRGIYYTTDASSAEYKTYIQLHLTSITAEYYNYLRAINTMQVSGFSFLPVFEPTVLPNNIKGGIGVLGLGGDGIRSFALPEVEVVTGRVF